MAGHLAGETAGNRAARPLRWLLATVAAAGLLLISLCGLGIVSTAALVTVPTALFLAVYLGAMVAAARVLRGPVRLAALPAALAVIIVLGFCGWALTMPAAVALTVGWRHGHNGVGGRASRSMRTRRPTGVSSALLPAGSLPGPSSWRRRLADSACRALAGARTQPARARLLRQAPRRTRSAVDRRWRGC
jgi:hypothetical protein